MSVFFFPTYKALLSYLSRDSVGKCCIEKVSKCLLASNKHMVIFLHFVDEQSFLLTNSRTECQIPFSPDPIHLNKVQQYIEYDKNV